MKRALKGLFRKGEANVVKIICLSVGLPSAWLCWQKSFSNGRMTTSCRD